MDRFYRALGIPGLALNLDARLGRAELLTILEAELKKLFAVEQVKFVLFSSVQIRRSSSDTRPEKSKPDSIASSTETANSLPIKETVRGGRIELSLPLPVGLQSIGLVRLARSGGREFTESERSTIAFFCECAAIQLWNAKGKKPPLSDQQIPGDSHALLVRFPSGAQTTAFLRCTLAPVAETVGALDELLVPLLFPASASKTRITRIGLEPLELEFGNVSVQTLDVIRAWWKLAELEERRSNLNADVGTEPANDSIQRGIPSRVVDKRAEKLKAIKREVDRLAASGDTSTRRWTIASHIVELLEPLAEVELVLVLPAPSLREAGRIQWTPKMVVEAIGEKLGPRSGKIAERILLWSTEQLGELVYSKGALGTVTALVPENKISYRLFRLYSSGQIEIPFSWLASRPAFQDKAKRLELLERFNRIPTIHLPLTALNRNPRIRLNQLEQEGALEKFLQVLEWEKAQICSGSSKKNPPHT